MAGLALWLVTGEFIAHYLIDWSKMNLNANFGWRCNESNAFWVLLGVDQLLHAFTYLGIAAAVAS
jgi:hypothetical protein